MTRRADWALVSVVLVILVVLVSACSGAAPGVPSTAGPTATTSATATGTATVPPTGAISPSPSPSASTGAVVLHGSFAGHTDDPASTSDATFDVLVTWKRPVDVHDRLNFQFASGSYTFKTSVTGVCGGTLSPGGPLALLGNDKQALIFGDPQDRTHEVQGSLNDNRLNQGGLQMTFSVKFDIPSGAVECQPPYESYGYVSGCTMEFLLATQDTLKPDVTCTKGGTTWTGHLVAQ